MNKGKILTFRLPTDLHYKIVEQAVEEGSTISDVARNIISKHIQTEAVIAKLDEIDIARRFRELYAQARIANHGIDALARLALNPGNYDQWRAAINQGLQQEAARKKNEEATR